MDLCYSTNGPSSRFPCNYFVPLVSLNKKEFLDSALAFITSLHCWTSLGLGLLGISLRLYSKWCSSILSWNIIVLHSYLVPNWVTSLIKNKPFFQHVLMMLSLSNILPESPYVLPFQLQALFLSLENRQTKINKQMNKRIKLFIKQQRKITGNTQRHTQNQNPLKTQNQKP